MDDPDGFMADDGQASAASSPLRPSSPRVDVKEFLWCDVDSLPYVDPVETTLSNFDSVRGWTIKDGNLKVTSDSKSYRTVKLPGEKGRLQTIRMTGVIHVNNDDMKLLFHPNLAITLPSRLYFSQFGAGEANRQLKSINGVLPLISATSGYVPPIQYDANGSPADELNSPETSQLAAIHETQEAISACQRPGKLIHVNQICTDNPRRPVSQGHLQVIKQCVLNQKWIPASTVVVNKIDGVFKCIDGCHRILALQQLLSERPGDADKLPKFINCRIYENLNKAYTGLVLTERARLQAEFPPLSTPIADKLCLYRQAAQSTVGTCPFPPSAATQKSYGEALLKQLPTESNEFVARLSVLPQELFDPFVAFLRKFGILRLNKKESRSWCAKSHQFASAFPTALKLMNEKEDVTPEQALQECGDAALFLRKWAGDAFSDDETVAEALSRISGTPIANPSSCFDVCKKMIYQDDTNLRRRVHLQKADIVNHLKRGLALASEESTQAVSLSHSVHSINADEVVKKCDVCIYFHKDYFDTDLPSIIASFTATFLILPVVCDLNVQHYDRTVRVLRSLRSPREDAFLTLYTHHSSTENWVPQEPGLITSTLPFPVDYSPTVYLVNEQNLKRLDHLVPSQCQVYTKIQEEEEKEQEQEEGEDDEEEEEER